MASGFKVRDPLLVVSGHWLDIAGDERPAFDVQRLTSNDYCLDITIDVEH